VILAPAVNPEEAFKVKLEEARHPVAVSVTVTVNVPAPKFIGLFPERAALDHA
jgi:hypothetical protein